MVASVAISAGIFSLVTARPLTRPMPMPATSAASDRQFRRPAVEIDEADRKHRRQHQHGGDRKVDAGDQDDEGLADRHHRDDGRRLQHVLDVAHGGEDRAHEAHDHAAEQDDGQQADALHQVDERDLAAQSGDRPLPGRACATSLIDGFSNAILSS